MLHDIMVETHTHWASRPLTFAGVLGDGSECTGRFSFRVELGGP